MFLLFELLLLLLLFTELLLSGRLHRGDYVSRAEQAHSEVVIFVNQHYCLSLLLLLLLWIYLKEN